MIFGLCVLLSCLNDAGSRSGGRLMKAKWIEHRSICDAVRFASACSLSHSWERVGMRTGRWHGAVACALFNCRAAPSSRPSPASGRGRVTVAMRSEPHHRSSGARSVWPHARSIAAGQPHLRLNVHGGTGAGHRIAHVAGGHPQLKCALGRIDAEPTSRLLRGVEGNADGVVTPPVRHAVVRRELHHPRRRQRCPGAGPPTLCAPCRRQTGQRRAGGRRDRHRTLLERGINIGNRLRHQRCTQGAEQGDHSTLDRQEGHGWGATRYSNTTPGYPPCVAPLA